QVAVNSGAREVGQTVCARHRIGRREFRQRACRARGTVRARDQERKGILKPPRAEIVPDGRAIKYSVCAPHHEAVFPWRLPGEAEPRAEVVPIGIDETPWRAVLSRQQLLASREIET